MSRGPTPRTLRAMLDERCELMLRDRQAKGRFRSIKPHTTRLSSRETEDGLIDFSSNDYLSLTHSPALRKAYLSTLSSHSSTLFGSTGSRLLDGTTSAHTRLESRLATFFSSPSALLFNSGWDANVSFFSSVPQGPGSPKGKEKASESKQGGDWIVFDELVHASVWDGMRASRVLPSQRIPFSHNSPSALRSTIERIILSPTWTAPSPSSPPLIFLALESLYSMDGDLLPLPSIITTLRSLIAQYPDRLSKDRLCVVVDEAHTTGLYGRGGRGLVRALEEEGGVEEGWVGVRVMTFGKGVGSQGAVLLSSKPVREFLVNYARPFIFSTGMNISTVLAIGCAFEVLDSQEGEQRRTSLRHLSQTYTSLLSPLIPTLPPHLVSLLPTTPSPSPSLSHSPIHPLLTPHPHALALHLQSLGYLVRPVVFPTVPKGKERVRVCLHSGNWEGDLRGLVEGVKDWVGLKIREEAEGVRARL